MPLIGRAAGTRRGVTRSETSADTVKQCWLPRWTRFSPNIKAKRRTFASATASWIWLVRTATLANGASPATASSTLPSFCSLPFWSSTPAITISILSKWERLRTIYSTATVKESPRTLAFWLPKYTWGMALLGRRRLSRPKRLLRNSANSSWAFPFTTTAKTITWRPSLRTAPMATSSRSSCATTITPTAFCRASFSPLWSSCSRQR